LESEKLNWSGVVAIDTHVAEYAICGGRRFKLKGYKVELNAHNTSPSQQNEDKSS